MQSIDQVIEQLEPVLELVTKWAEDLADSQNATYRMILSKSKDAEDFKRHILSYEPAAYFRNKANFDAAAKEITFPFEMVEDEDEAISETDTTTPGGDSQDTVIKAE
jgi:hypothetical protein